MGGLTLTIKLISAQLNYAAAGAGLSLAISIIQYQQIDFRMLIVEKVGSD